LRVPEVECIARANPQSYEFSRKFSITAALRIAD
jgi:hypothetical protein